MRSYTRSPIDSRRFNDDHHFTIGCIPFRVRRGKKGPNDLVMEWFTPEGWVPVPMAAGFLMADFFYENERELYPPPAKGGEKYLDAIRQAVRDGWRRASATLDEERAKKQLRLDGGEAA